jgi:hypothetical protein
VILPRLTYNWVLGFWREYPGRALFCELVHGYQVRRTWDMEALARIPNWMWPIRFPKRPERVVQGRLL